MQDVIFDKVAHLAHLAHLAHFNLLVVLEQQMKLQADRRPVNCFSYMSKTGLIAELKNVCAFISSADLQSGSTLAWCPLLRAEAWAYGAGSCLLVFGGVVHDWKGERLLLHQVGHPVVAIWSIHSADQQYWNQWLGLFINHRLRQMDGCWLSDESKRVQPICVDVLAYSSLKSCSTADSACVAGWIGCRE